jgi:hypothetical protein
MDAGPDRAGRVTEEDVAAVIQRAEDEVFALLQANWPIVERVTHALCKQDRLTSAELDALITGKNRAGSGSAGKRRRPKPVRPKPTHS